MRSPLKPSETPETQGRVQPYVPGAYCSRKIFVLQTHQLKLAVVQLGIKALLC
jgi:hypothetical protein